MKKFLSIIFVLFFLSVSAYAQEITKTKLPSGQTVIVKEVHTNPLVIVDTWVKTGSIDENDANNGVAHFLEHLFFKGSKNYPYNTFDKILEAKGAQTNAATSKDYTHFYILIPSEEFETALKLHSDMLTNPNFPKDEIDKERKVVIREIERSNDNPSRMLSKIFNKELYPKHPYRREVLGTKEIIASIPREEIVKFYSEHYSPENMITVVVGDVDSKQATELVEKYFENTSANKKSVHNSYKQDKKPEKQIYVNSKEDVKTSDLLIGYKCGLKVTDKDSYTLDVLSTILGGGKSSRLHKEIKDKQQIAQGISSSHLSMKEDSVFIIGADLNEENIGKVVKTIFSEVEKIKHQKVSQEELERAKKMIEREVLYAEESVAGASSEIGYSTLLTGDWNYSSEYVENIKKVTAEDIQKAAKKYLDEQQTIIATITPKNPEKAVKTKKISGKENNTCKNVSHKNFFKPMKHNPVKCEKLGKYNKYTLENGAKLIVDNHKNNEIVAINIKVKGGNYISDYALSSIVADVMTEGTEKYPKNVYAQLTEENGIRINPFSEAEYFGISMRCTKPDLPLALDMLYQVMNKAVLYETEIKKAKQNALYSIVQNRDNSANLMFEELAYALWENTPYDTTGKTMEKNIPSITVKNVEDFYKKAFDAKNAIIAVNGDVSEQEMIDYFSEVIKSNDGKTIDYKDYKGIFNSVQEEKKVVNYRGKESAWVVFAWKTDGIENKKDRITLKVIDAILGSGMSSRLFSEVRAQKGLAYAIGSSQPSFVNKGAFYVYIGTDPSRIDEAEKAMLAEVERLKKEFVTDKELAEAKTKLKGEAVLKMETNSAKAHFITVSEQNGNGADYYFDKFNHDVDSVTVSDIIQAANKYFSEPYIQSKVLPKK